jgi:hypothetical protein
VFERSATMSSWLLPKIIDEGTAWVAAGFRRIASRVASWSQNGFISAFSFIFGSSYHVASRDLRSVIVLLPS